MALNINHIRGAMNRANLQTMQDGAGSAIADMAIVYTTGDPSITPDGSITIANGAAPTVDELLEFCEELTAKQIAIITALEGSGILVE